VFIERLAQPFLSRERRHPTLAHCRGHHHAPPDAALESAVFAAAKAWDAAAVGALLAKAPELVDASDPKGRRALHMACAVTPGGGALGEANGIRPVTALLDGGAELEAAVPMAEEEGEFRATPLWYAVARMPWRAARTCPWCASCCAAAPIPAIRCGPRCGATTL
jgi:hypothetical protein